MGQLQCSGPAPLVGKRPLLTTLGVTIRGDTSKKARECAPEEGRAPPTSEPCHGWSTGVLYTALVPRSERLAGSGPEQEQDHGAQPSSGERRTCPGTRAPSRPRAHPQREAQVAAVLTMSTHACFPSMKPLGMEFGVRISYLSEKEQPGQPCLHWTLAWIPRGLGRTERGGRALRAAQLGFSPPRSPEEGRHLANPTPLFS